MPTLNWIGKAAVVTHHRDVPVCLLEPIPELGCGDAGASGNLIAMRLRNDSFQRLGFHANALFQITKIL